MGTAHSAEELYLCSHGLACQAGAWGRYIGFCPGYGHIWQKSKVARPAKIFCEAHNSVASHDEIITKTFLHINCGTLQMRIAVLKV
jgi:hypothetical protein